MRWELEQRGPCWLFCCQSQQHGDEHEPEREWPGRSILVLQPPKHRVTALFCVAPKGGDLSWALVSELLWHNDSSSELIASVLLCPEKLTTPGSKSARLNRCIRRGVK